jgi:AraC-like DNA-binding protein
VSWTLRPYATDHADFDAQIRQILIRSARVIDLLGVLAIVIPVDVLADVLAVAGVRGTVAATVDAAEPWGLTLGHVPGAAFHAVTDGTAWLLLAGRPGTRLMPGDVILLPTGLAHDLASGPDAERQPFDHLAAERALTSGDALHVGVGRAQTRIVCASYHQDPAITLPVLGLLPEVLHVPSTQATGALQATVRLLAAELSQPQPGSAAVLNHIVDILFIQLLRVWLATESPPAAPASWLHGLADPIAGRAITALHADPGRGWTIGTLAAHVGVSRATLARRFATNVGDSPAGYLTRWRMDLAARRLRDTDDPISVIAASVGYTSEYAFSRAFTRARRLPPGRYRSQASRQR